jgi:hypothetical protein
MKAMTAIVECLFQSHGCACIRAHTDKPISIKITFLSSYSSVKIIAYIAYKKPKAASGLDLDARHLPRF